MSSQPRLTVMCGLPGSGKSTWSESNRQESELVLSADIVRKRPRKHMPNQILGMQLLAPDHLRRGTSLIIDACSTNQRDRHEWIYLARCARATTRLVIIDTPLDVCLARQQDRGRAAVSPIIIRKQAAYLQAARSSIPSEGWGEILTVSSVAP